MKKFTNSTSEKSVRPKSVNSDLYCCPTSLGPVHTAPFLYKNGEKNLRFCESVHNDLHKNATKTDVFKNAIKRGYSQQTEVFANAFNQCERTKTEIFENAPSSNSELHKTGATCTHKNGYLWLRICTKNGVM